MKNRVLRSTLVVILVIAMVLTMAACGQDSVDPTVAPTTTPTTAPTTAPTTTPTTTPTETPDVEEEVVVDGDEAALAAYGITFEDESDTYDGAAISFDVTIDTDNIYQDAYTFSFSKISVSAANFEGKTISSSNYSAVKEDSVYTGEFQAYLAGVYTVTYTVDVEHDKSTAYGLYVPGEVDETYVVTKTYTIDKAEYNLSTTSDFFVVTSDITFPGYTLVAEVDEDDDTLNTDAADALKDADYEYSVNIAVTDCTEVGEYELTITIYDEDDNAVDPSDIVLTNYYVTVTNGTRYIISNEDVAKANVVRRIASMDVSDATSKDGNYEDATSTEYSAELIAAYEALTDVQKMLAEVANPVVTEADGDTAAVYKYSYLVAEIEVDADQIALDQYNLEREELLDGAIDLLDAYMTAAVGTNKTAALKALAEYFLALDNEETDEEYASDLLFVLDSLADTSVSGTPEYQVVVKYNAVSQYIISYTAADNEATLVSDMATATSTSFVVDQVYGNVLAVYEAAYSDYVTAYGAANVQKLSQSEVTALVNAVADLDAAYADLLYFQADLVDDYDYEDDSKYSYDDAVAMAEIIISRWDTFIEIIDAYGFNATYIDNANSGDYAATLDAMTSILGYDLVNSSLYTTDTDGDTSLADIMFVGMEATDGVYNYVPDLFMDDAIAYYEEIIEAYFDIQTAVDAAKTDLFNNVLASSTNYTKLTDGETTTVDSYTGSETMTDLTLEGLYSYIDYEVDKYIATFNANVANSKYTVEDAYDLFVTALTQDKSTGILYNVYENSILDADYTKYVD